MFWVLLILPSIYFNYLHNPPIVKIPMRHSKRDVVCPLHIVDVHWETLSYVGQGRNVTGLFLTLGNASVHLRASSKLARPRVLIHISLVRFWGMISMGFGIKIIVMSLLVKAGYKCSFVNKKLIACYFFTLRDTLLK